MPNYVIATTTKLLIDTILVSTGILLQILQELFILHGVVQASPYNIANTNFFLKGK